MTTSHAQHLPTHRQPGITERPTEHLLLVTLDLVGTDPQDCRRSVGLLRDLVQAELRGHLADPAVETGELGYLARHPDHNLTVTVGFSTTAYTKLAVPPERRPVDLAPIPADVLDPTGQGRSAENPGEGDVVLKIASDDVYVCEHVLRRVEHELGGDFAVTWVQTGSLRYDTRQSENPRTESRALIGFLDGTSNLDPSVAADRGLVFTDHTRTDYPPLPTPDQYGGARFPNDLRPPPASAEPAALDAGTYLAVEVVLIRTAPFDAQAVADQEREIGRDKQSGKPLAQQAPTSHVLKSNPGRPGDETRRFLRRGYPLVRPHDGGLGRGLVFLAFGRTLSTQAEFVRRAWINNPDFPTAGAGPDLFLGTYVEPVLLSGGYYFVPPLEHPSEPWTWVL